MPLKDGSNEDFEAAAIRHFKDASALQAAGRFDNAGHLIGFSAECAIKHRIDTLEADETSPNQHLPYLLNAARKLLGKRAEYVRMHTLLKPDIFADWSVDTRYAPTGKISQNQTEAWFTITKRLLAAANIRERSA